jgi:Chaperone of endosialidase/Head domain of trimeric autotransporter adhesin
MKYLFLITIGFCFCTTANSQSLAINTDGTTANSSAILDIKSTTKGVLISRMDSAQRATIAAPATGLLVFQTNKDSGFYFYDGAAWQQLISPANNLWKKNGTQIHNTNNGNVGIGITNPVAKLQVADSSVLFSAVGDKPAIPGNPPISGTGRRMMWYADKAAFRVGYAASIEWDKASIGNYSFASGNETRASGNFSTAMGYGSVAIGQSSTAMGIASTALGQSSIAMGYLSYAAGSGSTAIGDNTYAVGIYSLAMGNFTTASGGYSTAMGNNSQAIGYSSMAMGDNTIAKAFGSLSVCMYNDNTDNPNPVMEPFNRIFQIGNGTASVRSNALTVLRNGYIGIGTVTPNAPLQFSNTAANRKIVLWDDNNNNHQFYGFGINSSMLRYQVASAGDDHVFYSGSGTNSSTELFRIKGDGNTGVGVNDPVYRLDVGGRMRIRSTIGNSAGIWLNNDANNLLPAFIGMRNDDLVGFFGFGAPNNGWGFVMNRINGRVGIGTDIPTQALHVVGNICATGSIGSCSDMRYKKDLSPITHSLQSVLSLSGFYYQWKKDEYPGMQFSNSRQLGFSAQEVEKLFPEIVMTDDNGYKSVDYARLTPVLVEAIKEQQKQIDELKKLVEKILK